MPSPLSVRVDLGARSYDVLIGSGILSSLGNHARELFGPRKCAIVTDSHVGPLYAETARQSLADQDLDPVVITVPAGEGSKSMSIVEDVCRQMLRAGLD